MKQTLWIDSSAGISGDRLAAALIGLGAPEKEMMHVIQVAAEELGMLDAHIHIEFLADDILAYRMHLVPLEKPEPLSLEDTSPYLERSLARAEVEGPYAEFASRALSILRATETYVGNATPVFPEQSVSLPIIGTAHTPYKDRAPYQPEPENVKDGAFYIQVIPQHLAGMQALETFSHIFVLSYLDRALEPEITVHPPWKDSSERFGVFATRSPNRPSPIGLTRARLLSIEENRIYTTPLDLYNGTPILDIKPFIRSLDGMADDLGAGNDGWLEGSDHLELHRLGIPHTHPGGSVSLAQPHILIVVLTGIGWGLQHLGLDLSSVVCTSPVNSNPEHALDPATQAILKQYKIPYQAVSDTSVLLTPDGAAILAALAPEFASRDEIRANGKRSGLGLGQQMSDAAPYIGALRLFIV